SGALRVGLRYRLKALSHTPAELTVGNDASSPEIALKAEGSDDMYTFSYSTDHGATWQRLGELNARYLSTETAGGFTGITLGLYATAPQQASTPTAVFKDFTYTPLTRMAE
ncbi:MAG: glycoside hydrolase family 43 protein, partial [Muribaculaceae bacterium]|nr:glycoside hydrolase family 43 protein [Muribaculaceae bacterium]